MSHAHEVRLEREGLDNIENLCCANPLDLAVRTGFSYTQLSNWIDEAWLRARLRDDYDEFERRTGIATKGNLTELMRNWSKVKTSVSATEFLATSLQEPLRSKVFVVAALALEETPSRAVEIP